MKRFTLTVLAALILFLGGCAHVISPAVRRQAQWDLSVSEVQKNPDYYRGKVVIWSGRILSGENLSTATVLEILQLPADRQGRPRDFTRSEGRFLARDKRFLDTALYAPGRLVTVAGTVAGAERRRVGQVPYTYPVLDVLELHLWPQESQRVRDPYACDRYPPIWWHFYFGHGW
ncbi:outer membrane lipoprotein [Desulfacinum hydrothermale DSM 13146]|uniref:Outer membrane lipoprotein n=1 Tax=Desulfacinum hydrothermale DSM 13146 TaxID=1121390 RepID=A0A1W1X0C7_9BACT|nr:Slp family lipoprotein [Desulfacinum hydrothermale]SMC17347.1 outer membrane lipoprotein [Desulfacinum hydrothermale DSM 13146]